MRRILVIAAWLALVPGARAEGQIDDLLGSREAFFRPHIGEQVPADLTFRDDAGKVVRLGDYYGKRPIILVPAYYRCPMLCNLVQHDLVKALRRINFTPGEDYEVVVVSFDPREAPDLAAAKKRAALEEFGRPGTEGGWHFLTGEQKDIDALLEAVGFRVIWDARREQYVHARGILLLTPEGKVSRYLIGGDYPSWELRLELVEASQGKVGKVSDQILLMCFVYDPSMGRYSASVLGLVRLGAVFTLAALGLFFVSSWLRGRRGKAPVPATPVPPASAETTA